jgi:uncharacterized protein with HEPN domain
MDGAAFLEDHKTYDAVERCLERISEAARKIGVLAEELCPGIAWAEIRALGISCGMNTIKSNAGVSGWWSNAI